MSDIDRIKPVLETKLEEMGFELFDLRFIHAGKRSVLRITIDSAKGVSIADCESVSNEISLLLDLENFSSGRPYNLEVSSPGIDRPLKTARDFRRVAGREVVLHLSRDIDGKKTIRGKLIACSDNKLKVEIEHNYTVEILLSDIYSGREEIRFK